MTVMDWIAALVGLIVASTTIWALRRSPEGFFETFQTLWPMPWGKQIVIDFYGLEAVLALFMITHAMASGTWIAFAICIVLMPFLGATAAAAYWLFAVA